MLKKSALLSCGVQHQICAQNVHIKTSPSSPPQQHARPDCSTFLRRSYADVRASRGPDFHDNIHWPKLSSTSDIPTPYQIFQLDRGSVYSKRRFYQLVKIYHPDRNAHPDTDCGGISHTVKLERYRLIILANEILSDPAKKKAYDNHGLGWHQPTWHGVRRGNRHTRGYQGSGQRPFGTGPGCDTSPFKNATCEDWELWRMERDRGPHTEKGKTKMSPNAFASFIIVFAVLTGITQATQAGQFSTSLEEKIRLRNAETDRFLNSRKEEQSAVASEDDNGRLKWFLQKRDPTAYGLKPEEEATYRSTFSPHPRSARGKGRDASES